VFYHKISRSRSFLLAFLASLALHSLFFILHKNTLISKKNLFNSEQENHIVFVESPNKQIVNQERFNNIPTKNNTYYLSKEDNSVETQTQAMLKGLFHESEKTAQKKELKNTELKKTSTSMRKMASLEENTTNKIHSPIIMDIADLTDNLSFMKENPQDPSQTIDFLPGIKIGMHTSLNTKQFTYYSYFSRMKKRLYWDWIKYFKTEPRTFLSIRENKQKLFSTNLYVYLSPEGEIQDISVVKSSGSDQIDQAALHAFMAAAPFPNPPQELLEEDGFIHIKQSFHLYISNPAAYMNLFSKH